MLSDTLSEGLRNYEIGEKIHALRMRKKMGLVELGRHTGLSPALLSKLERSKIYPPLPTLLRIALVFGVGLDFFFRDETKQRSVAVMRKADRKRFPNRAGADPVSYFFESLEFNATERKLSAYLAEFEPVSAEEAEIHQHEGAEFLYVFAGTLILGHGRQEIRLDAGDSAYFDSSVPHTYRRSGRNRCQAIVVTA